MSHWPDRDIAEWGVARLFTEIASAEPGYPFSEPRARGKGNDPPDCEALDNDGRLIAFEITELVDGQAIAETKRAAMKGSGLNRWAEWSPARIREEIQARLGSKDRKTLQGGPYAEYIVLLHTDEPALVLQTIENALDGYRFAPPGRVDRAYLLLSYDPNARQLSLRSPVVSSIARKTRLHRQGVGPGRIASVSVRLSTGLGNRT